MKISDFDFESLSSFELFGLEYTHSRLVVLEFIGAAKNSSDEIRHDALTQTRLYLIDCAMLDTSLISDPSTSSSFPPFDRANIRMNGQDQPHRYTLELLFKPGFIRLDFSDFFFNKESLPMTHLS